MPVTYRAPHALRDTGLALGLLPQVADETAQVVRRQLRLDGPGVDGWSLASVRHGGHCTSHLGTADVRRVPQCSGSETNVERPSPKRKENCASLQQAG